MEKQDDRVGSPNPYSPPHTEKKNTTQWHTNQNTFNRRNPAPR